MGELTTFDKWWYDYCVKQAITPTKIRTDLVRAAWHAAAIQGIPAAVGATLLGAKAHTAELREAWSRGVIDERDSHSALRSNRNAEIDNALYEAIGVLFPARGHGD